MQRILFGPPSPLRSGSLRIKKILGAGIVNIYSVQDADAHVRAERAASASIDELVDELEDARQQLRRKNELIREIDHRTRNTFQIGASLLRLQASRAASPEVRAALASAGQRLLTIATAHDFLNEDDQANQIGLHDYLVRLCNNQNKNASGKAEVRIQVDADPVYCAPEVAMAAGMLLTEALNNAFTHAFAGLLKGRVRITLRQLDPMSVRLCISDDGVGCRGVHDGLGIAMIRSLLVQLGGTLQMNSSAGLGFTLIATFPIQRSAPQAPEVRQA
jgi:chemotaxis family two-component system sensor kinase Cph1